MSNIVHSAWCLVAVLGLHACGHTAPPSAAPAALDVPRTEVSEPKAAPVTPPAASPPALQAPTSTAEAPSIVPAIIRELQAQFEGGTGTMVDAKKGVLLVKVGGFKGQMEFVPDDTMRRQCGKVAAKLVRDQLPAYWSDAAQASGQQITCDSRSCVLPAMSEWGSEHRIYLRRDVAGKLAVEALTEVVDVPMRQGADEDIALAEKRVGQGASLRCGEKRTHKGVSR